MKSPVFVFLGVTGGSTDSYIGILKNRLEVAFESNKGQVKFDIKEDLLIITLSDPHFCYYISFVKNDYKTVVDWKELAKNFELRWDIKPVDRPRLINIFADLEAAGWSRYGAFQSFGFTILAEMEAFSGVKIFTIPSMPWSTIWTRCSFSMTIRPATWKRPDLGMKIHHVL